MNTSMMHLTILQREQLQTIIQIIKKKATPEKIILFGIYASKDKLPDYSVQIGANNIWGNFDILVVTRHGEHRSDTDILDAIVNTCRSQMPVTLIVHDIDYVNLQLKQGRYFFSTLYHTGILLHDAGRTPLQSPAPTNFEQVKALARKDFEKGWGMCRGFFRTAQFNIEQRQWKIAAFLLHQTTEYAFQTILLVHNGYKPCTHNLNKLRQYTSRFSLELYLLFRPDDVQDSLLFRLLGLAYVDARYKEDYPITENDLTTLMKRVEKLLSLVERLCNNRMIYLDKLAACGCNQSNGKEGLTGEQVSKIKAIM